VYRQSTESLTKSRLAIVQSVKPPGYDEWAARAKKIIADNPKVFESNKPTAFPEKGTLVKFAKNRDVLLTIKNEIGEDQIYNEWAGERIDQEEMTTRNNIPWEAEPPLEATQ
jgi:NADH dehydrogenase (ubiquinone) 1 alpha subcomplex subunit 5